MLRTYVVVSMPIFSAVTTSTLLNHTFGIEPALHGFLAHAGDVARPGVVAREGEQRAVLSRRTCASAKYFVMSWSMYFAPAWTLDSAIRMSPTFSSAPVAGMICMTPMAPTWLLRALIELRLLVALRSEHERIEAVLLAVLSEQRERVLEALAVRRSRSDPSAA